MNQQAAHRTCTLAQAGANRLMFQSTSHPHGALLSIEPRQPHPFSPELLGNIDSQGIWRWDGEGEHLDPNGTPLCHLMAWNQPRDATRRESS